MSERGSWCTGVIYCEKCIEGFRNFLKATEAMPLWEPPFRYWSGAEVTQSVFAGRISGLHPGEEFEHWEFGNLAEELPRHICHPVRVAVLSDTAGEKTYTFKPCSPAKRK